MSLVVPVNPDGSITDSVLQQEVVSYMAGGFNLANIANYMATGVPPVSMTVVKLDRDPFWRLVSDTFVTFSVEELVCNMQELRRRYFVMLVP